MNEDGSWRFTTIGGSLKKFDLKLVSSNSKPIRMQHDSLIVKEDFDMRLVLAHFVKSIPTDDQ
jgi:hypothetical protein